MSSRNAFLSTSERKAGLVLSKSLFKAKELSLQGITNSKEILTAMKQIFDEESLVALDYIEIADKDTLGSISDITNGAVILVAAKVGNTRLIDNIVI